MKKLSIFWLAMLPTVIAVAPEDTARPPTPEVCPAPIDDTPYITGLETGQVVTQDGATTLRFSSDARACGEWSTEYRSDCRDHWMFHITIPATRLSPGTYELGKIDASFGDLVVRTGEQSGAGCAHECTERGYRDRKHRARRERSLADYRQRERHVRYGQDPRAARSSFRFGAGFQRRVLRRSLRALS